MNLIISLRSELLKTKRTSLWYLCVIIAALIPLMLFFDASSPDTIKALKTDPWNEHFRAGIENMSIFFLPLFVILTYTLLPQIEYRNNTWKQVFTSPQPLGNIYISKFLITQLLVLAFFISFNFFMVMSAFAANAKIPALAFLEHSLDWRKLILLNGQAYVSFLAIYVVQFWAGIRFKNFMFPIALGFCLLLTGVWLVLDVKWEHADLFPYSFPLLIIFKKSEAGSSTLLWSSIGYSTIFFIMGYLDFQAKNIKG